MRAATFEAFGPPEVVSIREVPTPTPADDQVLIRVHATTVSAADRRLRSRDVPTGFGIFVRLIFGWSRPKQPILGTDAAGVVVAVGKSVTRFSPGDAVIAFVGAKTGCHAEYVCVGEGDAIIPKPSSVSFEDAVAMCFGGTTALHYFREAALAPGERVLIFGATGAVGSAAIQLAKQRGAHVTAVCGATNVALARELGAAEVIEYTQQDALATGKAYDVIMDNVGSAPFALAKASLARGGRLLAVVASLPAIVGAAWVALATDKRVVVGSAPERAADLVELVQLVETGRFKPVIGARFPLDAIVEAHRLADSGHKRGSAVVLPIAEGPRG